MQIKILENGNILVEKNGKNYLIERDFISGTLIANYFVYEDIYNNVEKFLKLESEERYFYGDFETLERALVEINLAQ